MSLKLNMAKAYDQVKWTFLETILRLLRFAEVWVSLVMRYVTFVLYSNLVNGSLMGPFSPSFGLRQGELLSPYLFLLCTEGLTSLLREAVCNSSL